MKNVLVLVLVGMVVGCFSAFLFNILFNLGYISYILSIFSTVNIVLFVELVPKLLFYIDKNILKAREIISKKI